MPQLSFNPPQRAPDQQAILDVFDPQDDAPKLSFKPPKQSAPKLSFMPPKLSFAKPQPVKPSPMANGLPERLTAVLGAKDNVLDRLWKAEKEGAQQAAGGIKKIITPPAVGDNYPGAEGAGDVMSGVGRVLGSPVEAMAKPGGTLLGLRGGKEQQFAQDVSVLAQVAAGAKGLLPGKTIKEAAISTPEGTKAGIPGETHAQIQPGAPEAQRQFIDSDGKVETRKQAAVTAQDAGQVQRSDELTPGKLHSEDLPAYKSKIFSPDEPVASTAGTATPKGLHDVLQQHQQAAQLDMKELGNFIKPLRGAVPEAAWEKFLDHADDPKGVPLTPEETKLFDNTIGKMREEIDAIREQVTGAGVKPGDVAGEGEGSLGGAVRISKQYETPLGKMLGEKPAAPVSGRSVSRTAGTFKGRSMMNLTIDGKRTPVHVTEDGDVVDARTRGKVGVYDPEAEQVELNSGKADKLSESTRKEIEEATGGNVSYHKNALGVYATTLLNARRAARSVKLMETIKTSPEFNQVARGPLAKSTTPYEMHAGHKVYWREVQGIPGFKGYKFAPRVAEELEDFVHGGLVNMGELSALDRLNKFELNLFFFMQPFHGYNLTEMALATRAGLGDTAGLPRDFAAAAKDVMAFRKPYVKYARSGVPLPGLFNAGEGFRKITLEAMGVQVRRNPLAWRENFKALLGDEGLRMSPGQMLNFFADASKQAVQSYQDILQLALLKGAERRGLNIAQAREAIAKTFPSDSPQSRVMGSRLIGQAMQSQAFLQFPHYFYNRTKGMANILGGLKGPERVRAAKQLAAVIMTYEMGKQIYTPLLQQWTGNQNAQSGGFGYDVFPEAVERLRAGMSGGDYGRTIGQTLQSLASQGYGVQALDLVRGINPYFGKPVSVLGEKPGEIASDYASEFMYHLSPVQRAMAVSQGRMAPKDLAYQQLLGVKFPSNPEAAKGYKNNLRMRERYPTAADQMTQKMIDYFAGKK